MSDLATILGRRLAALSAAVPRVVSATVVSDAAGPGGTRIELDTGPGAARPAQSLGATYTAGTRVLCLAYPPRGLLILGPTDPP